MLYFYVYVSYISLQFCDLLSSLFVIYLFIYLYREMQISKVYSLMNFPKLNTPSYLYSDQETTFPSPQKPPCIELLVVLSSLFS